VNLLDRYIAVSVLKSVALVVVVLVAVATFIELVGQLDDVGTVRYRLEDALSYVALRMPRTVFMLLPAAALLGALLSLGNLAVHRELIVMRASGVSRLRLLGSVGVAGVVLSVSMALLGDSLAPSLAAYARALRAQALEDNVDLAGGQSTWLKDGDRIVSLHREADGFGFGGVYLFELEADRALKQVARADSAAIDETNRWVLANYAETAFDSDGISARVERESVQSYGLSVELLDLSVVRHDLLDTQGLKRYISYLQANELDAAPYLIAYWARMADIVSALLMTILALPFVFGGLRSAGTGARLLVGLLIGLGYYVTAQTIANSGQVFDLDPRIVAWLPSVVLLAITAVALARTR